MKCIFSYRMPMVLHTESKTKKKLVHMDRAGVQPPIQHYTGLVAEWLLKPMLYTEKTGPTTFCWLLFLPNKCYSVIICLFLKI